MKNLIALLMVLFFAGFMMAQSTSKISQNGVSNSATIDQAGGAGNYSEVTQNLGGGVAVGSDIYDLTQNGSGNISKLNQNGHMNSATIEQIGTDNILQNSKYEAADFARQNVKNTFDLSQHGSSNITGLYQNNQKNFADIDQIGNGNGVELWQSSFGGPTTGNTATLYQEGSLNNSEVYQTGESSPAGNQNAATGKILGSVNTTSQMQHGTYNQSTVYIGFQSGGPTYTSSHNSATATQTGNYNQASFGLTWGDYNGSVVSQSGDNNYTEFSVKYGNSNTMNESVSGDNNRTRFSVNAPWLVYSIGNSVEISKTGNKNYVSGAIQGNDNVVTVTQTGNNNLVGTSWYTGDGVNITGNTNTVGISQTTDGNSTLNSVIGNGNNINVDQH